MNLPADFSHLFRSTLGEEDYRLLAQAMDEPSPVSVRLHPHKLRQVSSSDHPILSPIPWTEDGFYVSGDRPTFGADPLWHAGGYYVQEPGSMFVTSFLRASGIHPEVAIDLCAAPGGKSTLLRSALPEGCVLIANEPDGTRASILKENIRRYGADETIVTSAYPKELADTGIMADLILVDAPCSGEGMFRKEEAAVEDWSPDNVRMCKERQRQILTEAWRMLRRGGVLIYSTCTYNREENDRQLDFLKENYDLEVLSLDVPSEWGIRVEDNIYRFIPGRVRSEGFTTFAVVKRDGEVERASKSRNKSKMADRMRPHGMISEIFGEEPEYLYSYHEEWRFLSPQGMALLTSLQETKGVRVLQSGVTLGSVKGKDFIPHQDWVCSYALAHRLPYPKVELDAVQALAYLKRNAVTIDPYKGIQVMTYEVLPIGLVKNLSNRVNTLYPKEMSIKNRNLSVDDIPKWGNELEVIL